MRGEGGKFADGDPASARYLLRTLPVGEVVKMPRTEDVCENLLGRSGVTDAVRAEALATLAKIRHTAPVTLLVQTIDSPAEIDVRAVGRLLVAQAPADLKPQRAELLKLALADNSDARSWAFAAVALGDGSLDPAWQTASASPLSFASLLGGIHLIPSVELRATAFDRVMAILAMNVTDIQGPDNIVAAIQRDAIFFHHSGNRALRVGDWKLVSAEVDHDAWELYDLATDRGETNNLAAKNPERVREMSARWQQMQDEFTRQAGAGSESK